MELEEKINPYETRIELREVRTPQETYLVINWAIRYEKRSNPFKAKISKPENITISETTNFKKGKDYLTGDIVSVLYRHIDENGNYFYVNKEGNTPTIIQTSLASKLENLFRNIERKTKK